MKRIQNDSGTEKWLLKVHLLTKLEIYSDLFILKLGIFLWGWVGGYVPQHLYTFRKEEWENEAKLLGFVSKLRKSGNINESWILSASVQVCTLLTNKTKSLTLCCTAKQVPRGQGKEATSPWIIMLKLWILCRHSLLWLVRKSYPLASWSWGGVGWPAYVCVEMLPSFFLFLF